MNYNMVEDTNKKTETSGSVTKESEVRMQIIELKMKVDGVEEDDKRMLYLLKSIGETGYRWYVKLEANQKVGKRVEI
jgi:hypothetical protein